MQGGAVARALSVSTSPRHVSLHLGTRHTSHDHTNALPKPSKIVYLDLDSPSSLKTLFEQHPKIKRVFYNSCYHTNLIAAKGSCEAAIEHEVAEMRNFLDALERNNVELDLLVVSSCMVQDPSMGSIPFVAAKQVMESLVRDSGVPYCIVRPSLLMTDLFQYWHPTDGVVTLPIEDTSLAMVDPDDVGEIVSKILQVSRILHYLIIPMYRKDPPSIYIRSTR